MLYCDFLQGTLLELLEYLANSVNPLRPDIVMKNSLQWVTEVHVYVSSIIKGICDVYEWLKYTYSKFTIFTFITYEIQPIQLKF